MATAVPLPYPDPAEPLPVGKVGGQLVYAIGDIHGCYDLLKQILSHITVDAGSHAAGRTPTLIFCGDYVDRGPASAQVLDALCWLKRRSPFTSISSRAITIRRCWIISWTPRRCGSG